MRIERIEASRHKRGRVLVFLEDGACLKITEQELLDFGLRAGDLLDQAALRRLKEAAGASNTKAAAADLVGRRAMSRRDLERKLREKGASEAEAHYAAEWMEAIGAINDADYAAALVRHCGEKGYGPARVREKLHEKGVPRELWEEALEALPDPAGQIDRFLLSKLRGRTPDEKEKKRLCDALARRGFAWPDISGAMDKLAEEQEELRVAVAEHTNIREELGDVLFAAAAVARYAGIDPEQALQEATDKYISRFACMERSAAEQGRSIAGMRLDEMIQAWNHAKQKLQQDTQEDKNNE